MDAHVFRGGFLVVDSEGRLFSLSKNGKHQTPITIPGGDPVISAAGLPGGGLLAALRGDQTKLVTRDARGQCRVIATLPSRMPDPRFQEFDAARNHPSSSPGKVSAPFLLDLAVSRRGLIYAWDPPALTLYRFQRDGAALPALKLPGGLARYQKQWTPFPYFALCSDYFCLGGCGGDLQYYSLEGTLLRTIRFPEQIAAIAAGPKGDLMLDVSPPENDGGLMELSPMGQIVRQWGYTGERRGELLGYISQIAPEPGGNLWTVERDSRDYTKTRLQHWVLSRGYTPARLHVIRTAAPMESPPIAAWQIYGATRGDAFGALTGPAVDRRGRVYVGENRDDSLDDRPGLTAGILIFSPTGKCLGEFGRDDFGGPDGVVSGLAIARDRDVLYAECPARRKILIFSLRGAKPGHLVGSIPLPPGAANSADADDSEVRPFDLASSPNGKLFIPDDVRGRIWVYDPGTKKWTIFGAWGSGPQDFGSADAIAVEPDGSLCIANGVDYRRISKLDSRKRYVYEVHAGARSLAAAPGGGIVAAGGEIDEFTQDGRLQWKAAFPNGQVLGWAGLETSAAFDELPSGGVAVAPDGSIYLSSKSPELQSQGLESYWSLTKLVRSNSTFGQVVGKASFFGAGRGQFSNPCGIAVDHQGNSYVTDFNNDRVQKFDPHGRFLLQFGAFGGRDRGAAYDDASSLECPIGIALSPDDSQVYVGDWDHKRIQVYDSSGKWLRQFGQGANPWGIATASDGTIYVSDRDLKEIRIFTPNGEELPSLGAAQGIVLSRPGMLAVRDGEIAVTDRDTGEVVVIDAAQRKELRRFGKGDLLHPDGVALDAQGRTWVADTDHHRVVVYGKSDRLEASFGKFGSLPGEFQFTKDVALGPGGEMFVTDWDNDRVQLFSPALSPIPTVTWGSFSPENSERGLDAVTCQMVHGDLFTGSGLYAPEPEKNSVDNWTYHCTLTTYGEKRQNGAWIGDAVFSGSRVYMLQLRNYPSDWNYDKFQVYLNVFNSDGAALLESLLPIRFERSGDTHAPPGVCTDFSAAIRPALIVEKDRIYAADPGNHRVLILDMSGRVVGTAASGFLPGGLAFDRGGELFISDPTHHQILVFDGKGRLNRRIHFKDKWAYPTSMTLSDSGDIDVLDIGAGRVKRLDRTGRSVAISPPLPDEWFTHISTGPDGMLCLANRDLTFLKQ